MTGYVKSILLLSFSLALLPVLCAENVVKLDARLFVYRTGDFASVHLSGASPLGSGPARLLRYPAAIQFDSESFTLGRMGFEWTHGDVLPPQFTLVPIPPLLLHVSKPVVVDSSVPVQYLERQEDGTLKVREIPSESPESPHIRVTFRRPYSEYIDAFSGITVRCGFDLATVAKRETLPGVSLDVGKPVIATVNQTCDISCQPEAWSAVSLLSPNENGLSLLLLIRVLRVDDRGWLPDRSPGTNLDGLNNPILNNGPANIPAPSSGSRRSK
ncbi:MAG TPA: hypothetical protein VGL42_15745 [Opitutaceae bacterium]|jgi:hypothetical protein